MTSRSTKLPKGFQALVADSDEYKEAFTPPSQGGPGARKADPNVDPLDDDIPF
jgi:hypothetical protein